MKTLLAVTVISASFLMAGCASKPSAATSHEARKDLESRYSDRVNKSTKADFTEDFGPPEWCRADEVGTGETCRYYRKQGTKWMGGKKDRNHLEQYDEIFTEFDSQGVLRNIKVNAQR